MKIGDTTASYFLHLLETARALGLNPEHVLADVGLTPRDVVDGEARLDLIYLMRLGHTIMARTGCRHIGLLAGKSASISRFGHAGLAAMTAPTLDEALRVLVQYEPLYARCYRGNSQWKKSGQDHRLSFYSIAPYNDYTYFVVDAVLSHWFHTIQFLTGRQDIVSGIHVEFATPVYHEQYLPIFGAPPDFHQECNELILKSTLVRSPCLHANTWLHQELIRECDQRMHQIAFANTYVHRVQRVLGTMLHGRTPSAEEVASQLGIPSWTLRRKLKEEQASFQEIVDAMRKDVALSYMRNTELSFGEISYLLGFSTPGAFQRAFKRWTDATPGQFRKDWLEKTHPTPH